MNTNKKNNNDKKNNIGTIIIALMMCLVLCVGILVACTDNAKYGDVDFTTGDFVGTFVPGTGNTTNSEPTHESSNTGTSNSTTGTTTPSTPETSNPEVSIPDEPVPEGSAPETTPSTTPSAPETSVPETSTPSIEEHICTFVIKETNPATCEEDGFEIMECSCGETSTTVIPAQMHDIYEKKTDATCTEDGFVVNICRRCNMEKKVETIPAKGHKYGDWVVSKEPTGFEKGSKYRVCSTCNHKDTDTIPKTDLYPIIEEGDGYKITITREWYKKAWVYAAHIEFTDYSRFGTSCANGKYKNGYETTSHAHNRLNAILTVNGCYSAPYLDYTVVRSGKIWNGANRNMCLPGVYSSHTGLFQSAWEGKQGTSGITGVNVQQLVDEGKVTDTFCFGPPGLVNGELIGKNEGARAQRTFMGTNGKAGDIWIVVSDGRYNDGESAGLTFYEGMEYLLSKGCTFGLHLDGGGSSTMVYRGHVLNAVKEERAVVDFVYFR